MGRSIERFAGLAFALLLSGCGVERDVYVYSDFAVENDLSYSCPEPDLARPVQAQVFENYVGVPTATRAPSSAPSFGVAPTLSLPIGTDAPSADSLRQPFEVLADFTAWILAGNWRAAINGDVPLLSFRDSNNNVRSVIDHLGYPITAGKSQFSEEWLYSVGIVSGNFTPIPGAPRWSASIGIGNIRILPPVAAYPSDYLDIFYQGTIAGRSIIYTSAPLTHTGATFLSLVIEWESAIGAGGGPSALSAFMGLSDSPTTPAAGFGNYIWFRNSEPGGGVWQADTAAAGVATSMSSGQSLFYGSDPSTGQRFRIEVHGSDGPYGSRARFFINEVLVATSASNIPSVPLYFICGIVGSMSASPQHILLGPVQAVWNRTGLSLPNL
jgi:hypothetical protein